MLRNALFRWIKNWEGVGAPDQPTIYGITEANYPKHYNRIKSLVDNGASKELIDDAVFDAYNEIYEKSGAQGMFYPLNWIYFDFYFNAGFNAGKVLQTVLNDNFHFKLKIDGIIGRKTLETIEKLKMWDDTQHKLVMLYALARVKYYTHLKKWNKGLINRAISLYEFIIKETFI